MPPPSSLPRVIWLFVYSWAACIVVYGLGIAITATLVDYLPTSVVAAVAYALVAAEIVFTGASIIWVYSRSGGLRPAARYVSVAAFALLQLATCAIALITTLLALNR